LGKTDKARRITLKPLVIYNFLDFPFIKAFFCYNFSIRVTLQKEVLFYFQPLFNK